MAAQANITVFDGASTPVSHTFIGEEVARLVDGSVIAKWKETSLTLPDYACNRITMTKRKLKNGVTRVSIDVEVPVMEAINAQKLLWLHRTSKGRACGQRERRGLSARTQHRNRRPPGASVAGELAQQHHDLGRGGNVGTGLGCD